MKDTETKLRSILLTFIIASSALAVGIALTGTAGAVSTSIDSTNQGSNILVGSYDEPIGVINFTEDSSGEWSQSGTAELNIPSSSSVTFNQSESNLFQQSSGNIANLTFIDDTTIEFDYNSMDLGSVSTIEIGGIVFDVPADAGSDGDTLTLDGRIGSNQDADVDLTLESTTADFKDVSDVNLATGGAQQQGDIIEINDTTTVGGTISSDSTVTVSIESGSGITYDQNQSLSVTGSGALSGEVTNPQFMDSQTIAVDITAASDGTDDGINISNDGGPIQFNVSNNADDGSFDVTVTTTPTEALGDVETQIASDLNVNGPKLNTNWDEAATPEHPVNITISNDGDGETQIDPDPIAGMMSELAYSDLNITSGAPEDISSSSAGTLITVTIPSNTGLTFDQSVDMDLSQTTEGGISSADVNATLEGPRTVEVLVESGSDSSPGDSILVNEIQYNVSGSTSSSVNLQANINRTNVDTTSPDFINTTLVDPDPVFGDANVSADPSDENEGPNSNHGSTNSGEATETLEVGQSVNGSVYAENSSLANSQGNPIGYGGAQVDLQIVQTPNSATGQSVTPTQLQTGSNGVTTQNFTFTAGDKAGTYIVNATTSTGGVNITYTVNPGDVQNVQVTPVKDAIRSRDDTPGQAKLWVNATDSNGNPVNQEITVDITASGNVDPEDLSAGPNPWEVPVDDLRYIEMNTTRQGIIDSNDPSNNPETQDEEETHYAEPVKFKANSGDVVTIDMESPGDDLDTLLWLQAPDGTNLADDDDGGFSGSNSTIEPSDYGGSLPQTGVYKIFATTYETAATGNYFLRVTENVTSSQGPIPSTPRVDDDPSDGQLVLPDGSATLGVYDDTAEDVNISASIDGQTDTGTVMFFPKINKVELSLNKSSTIRNSRVSADATIMNNNNVIQVPDVFVNFDDNQNANTSFVGKGATANTDAVVTTSSGTASSIVSADSQGTSTIDAQTALKKGSDTLTITRPALNVTTNVSTVTVGEETPVSANVTFENNGTATQGATINVSGAGVNVANQTTDSNGQATFTVNASQSGDITVLATLPTVDNDTTTIQAQPPVTPANFSLSELNAPDNITAGQNFDVSANVTNIGGQQGTQDVEFRFDLDENSTLESDETINSTSLTLNAGQSSTVTFNITDTAGLNGTFNHGFFTENSSLTTTIEIRNVSDEPPEEVYDTNNNGQIDGPEVRQAIRCFLFGTDCIGDQLTGQEVRAIITDFLFG